MMTKKSTPAPRKRVPTKKGAVKMGRPSLYTEALADRICEMLAETTSLHVICAMPGMPHEATIYRWLAERRDFCEKYARARERAADRFASETVSIADQADDKSMRGIEHARLRIDARKWAAGKFAPKKYAERLHQEITGKDGGPVRVRPEWAETLEKLTDEQLAQLEAIAAAVEGSGDGQG